MDEVNANKYFTWLSKGRSFSDVRNDLLIRGFTEEQTKQIIITLNDWLLKSEIEKSKRSNAKQWRAAGWVLALIVIMISLYSVWVSSFTVIVIAVGGAVLSWGMIYAGNKIEQDSSLFQKRFKNRRFR